MAWRDLAVRINECDTVLCHPGWIWDSPLLRDFDLWFIWAGRGTIQWKEQKYELAAGSMFCLQPGNCYHARQDPVHRLGVSFVHFDFRDACGQIVCLTRSQRPPTVARISEVDFFEQLFKQIVCLHHEGDGLARAEAAIYLRGAMAGLDRIVRRPTLYGTDKAHHEAIRSVTRYIRENSGELFSIEALAERAGYSTDHFSRIFRQIVGVAPNEFCIRTRLLRAKTLLQESSMNIGQIAQSLGYADVFFFSRQFRQRTGISPTQWRAGGTAAKSK